jgi:undecaprenyl-diphosphatase
LPAYDAIARIKVRGHWQSDVVVAFALGTAVGYYVHRRTKVPFVLNAMPKGIYVGLKQSW